MKNTNTLLPQNLLDIVKKLNGEELHILMKDPRLFQL